MIKWTSIILFLLFFSMPIYSQNIIKSKKKAKLMIENENYNGAINVYLDLLKNRLVDYSVYTNLGYCYLKTGDYDRALNFLEKSVKYYKSLEEYRKTDALNAMFYLATAYFDRYDFEKAKKMYISIMDYSNRRQMLRIKEKIIQCDSAQDMFEHPTGFFVYQPGIINSEYPDYCPVISPVQGKMYFTSRRPGSTGGKIAPDGYEYEDIYSVNLNNGKFSKPVNIGPPINTDSYEATASISYDGKTMFIYKSTTKDPGDIYVSELVNKKWTVPKRMGKPINKHSRETHASLSPDGEHIFFTSDRNGGYGGLDIYEADLSPNGKWVNVRNLGKYINSPKDEDGPFISPDGKYLYFASNGHIGMGGFDIYKSKIKPDGTWSKPVNMGFPLNTVNDDIFYVPTNNPEQAFYSSKQIGGVSSILVVKIYEDINNMIFVKGYAFDSKKRVLPNNIIRGDSVKYGFNLYPFDKKVYVGNDTVHVFHRQGTSVLDSVCKIPDNTSIKVYKVSDNSLVGQYSLSLMGKYGVPMSSQDEHVIYFSAPGYSYDVYTVKKKPGTYIYNAELDTIIKGKTKIVKYTVFDKDSTNLTDAQKFELNFLADYLNKNNNLCVDISSYGYNEIPETYDEQRTIAIENYLAERGIGANRIRENLSSDKIRDSLVQYTILDTSLVKKILLKKKAHLIAKSDRVPEPENEDRNGNNIKNNTEKNNHLSKSIRILHGVLVDDVRFAINMYDNPDFYDDLDVLAQFLVRNSRAKIGVYGYTDTQGPADYNKMLSKKRAIFVKNYLISKGAKSSQIIAQGKGYSKQISVNKNRKGQYIWKSLGYNRRVEIEILNQGQNEKLFVKPVDVPDQFQLDISSEKYYYSVNIVSSIKKIPSTAFDFNVIELKGVDGLYNYIYGQFEHEYQAENFIQSIKAKYPKAFVFINNYRK